MVELFRGFVPNSALYYALSMSDSCVHTIKWMINRMRPSLTWHSHWFNERTSIPTRRSCQCAGRNFVNKKRIRSFVLSLDALPSI
jgi:hypothetical protein